MNHVELIETCNNFHPIILRQAQDDIDFLNSASLNYISSREISNTQNIKVMSHSMPEKHFESD